MSVLASEVIDRHPRDASLLPAGHRRSRAAELLRHPRFDFDEHRRRPVLGDDVDFAESGAVTAFNNCVPAALQLGAREIFTANSESLPRIVGHQVADLTRSAPHPMLRRGYGARYPLPASSARAGVRDE